MRASPLPQTRPTSLGAVGTEVSRSGADQQNEAYRRPPRPQADAEQLRFRRHQLEGADARGRRTPAAAAATRKSRATSQRAVNRLVSWARKPTAGGPARLAK